MAETKLVHVYTVNEATEARLVQEALESEGIPCSIEGENQGSFTGVLQIRLFVRSEHAEAARSFLVDHEIRHHDEEE